MGERLKRNTTGLLQYAANLKSDTEEKANRTIDTLKRSKSKKINFKTVSELSGVSKTTLYNNPVLRERISSLRAVKQPPAEKDVLPAEKRGGERELRMEIQKLREEKNMLITQLVEFERLKMENQQMKALLSQRKIE